MKILAVDDDEILLELLAATLAALGHTNVETATSARTAIEIVKSAEEPYDCVLLDIQMPEMDGIELCGILRSMDLYRDVPILMITAMSDRSFIDRAFGAGATDYVNKPFDGLELGARLRIAEKLSNQSSANARKEPALVLVGEPSTGAGDSNFDVLGVIDDEPGVVDPSVLKNYMTKLSEGSAFLSSAVALQVSDFDPLSASVDPTELPAIIGEIARAIVSQMKKTSFIMSYFGNGTFVCVTRRADPIFSPRLQRDIQLALDNLDLFPDNTDLQNVVVSMTEPQTNSRENLGEPMQIINAAIETARRTIDDVPSAGTEQSGHFELNRLFGALSRG